MAKDIIISQVMVSLNQTKLILKRGESGVLSATVLPTSLSNRNVLWYSDNTNIATVDDGRVLGLNEGVTKIYAVSAFDNTVGDSCEVIVSNDILVSDIWINPGATTMHPGETANFTAAVTPLDATNKSVVWSSDDPSVASVAPNSGLVTANNPGTTMIRATAMDYSGESACCELVVESPYLVDKYGDEVVTFSYEEDGDKYLSKNFKVREFRCKDGSDEILIDMGLVRYLQQIRDWAGASITINSGYRTPSHNASIGGATKSQHIYGKAVDIVCSGKSPLQLAQKAETLGMKGIEWNKDLNYTHIDTRTSQWHVKRHNGVFVSVSSFYNLTE